MPADLSTYPPLVQTLLKNRGITNAAEAEHFLYPDFVRDVRDPFGIFNMEKAVERILCAIDAGERIAVFADYDCDGIPGAVIFHDFLKKINYENFEVYIPHRNSEGYGLNVEAIDLLASRGATLLITVDCGISDITEVAHSESLGMNVVITDHHLPPSSAKASAGKPDILPRAYAIVNPKQVGDTYHDSMLCGAAVVWKLVCALLARRGESWGIPIGWEKWLLDMAGLATIADMVPLCNENRALAHYGLMVIRKSRRPGILALLGKMDLLSKNITEDDIGFMIGPRLNAASRIGDPSDAFRLLASATREVADEYADKLMHLNDVRKGLVASMVKEARKHLEVRALREVVVIGNPLWKPGLAGLVAANLSEAYARPVFVWGRTEGGCIKGSCRSDGTVNVVELMTSVRAGVFASIGGHELAGGFSVSSDFIHTLEDELVSVYQAVLARQNFLEKNLGGREKEETEQKVEATLSLAEVNWVNWKQIEKFAPFGIGNPKPIFLFENVKLAEVRYFGKEKNHLELSFEGSSVKAILFFAEDEKYKEFSAGDIINLVATIEVNTFRNNRELRLRIVEVAKRG